MNIAEYTQIEKLKLVDLDKTIYWKRILLLVFLVTGSDRVLCMRVYNCSLVW